VQLQRTPHVRRLCHILISAFSEYRPWPPLHVYILTIKQVQLANMEPKPLDDPKKTGHRPLNAIVL